MSELKFLQGLKYYGSSRRKLMDTSRELNVNNP
jgi:hypothetical protein